MSRQERFKSEFRERAVKKRFFKALAILFTFNSPQAYAVQTPKLCALEEQYFIRTFERVQPNKQHASNGDEVTILVSEIAHTPKGERIGLNIARLTHLGLNHITPGAKGMTEALVTNFLPEGNLVSLQIIDSDQSGPHQVERPIIGGTGKYKGAQGIFIREPVSMDGTQFFKLTFKLNVQC